MAFREAMEAEEGLPQDSQLVVLNPKHCYLLKALILDQKASPALGYYMITL